MFLSNYFKLKTMCLNIKHFLTLMFRDGLGYRTEQAKLMCNSQLVGLYLGRVYRVAQNIIFFLVYQ